MAGEKTGIVDLLKKVVDNREFFESVGLSALTDEALARWSADILLKSEGERSWLERAFLKGSKGALSAALRAGAEALKLPAVEAKVVIEKATDAADFGMAQQILMEELRQRGMLPEKGGETQVQMQSTGIGTASAAQVGVASPDMFVLYLQGRWP